MQRPKSAGLSLLRQVTAAVVLRVLVVLLVLAVLAVLGVRVSWYHPLSIIPCYYIIFYTITRYTKQIHNHTKI